MLNHFLHLSNTLHPHTRPNVIILSQAKKLNKRLKRVGLTVSLRGIKVDIIIVIVPMVITIIIVAVADTIIINIVVINAILILQVVECDSGLPTMDYSIYRYLDILPMMLDIQRYRRDYLCQKLKSLPREMQRGIIWI